MPANINPIYSKAPALSSPATGIQILLTAAMTQATAFDGTDANAKLAFTADATNGGYVQKVRFKPYNTAGSTASTATVARIFINNGSTNATASNNTYYADISLPAYTHTAVAGTVEVDYPLNIALPAGYKLYVGLATAPGSTNGWAATVIAGTY